MEDQNLMTRKRIVFTRIVLFALPVCLALAMVAGLLRGPLSHSKAAAQATGTINQAFDQASQEFGVPVALLKSICQLEGRLSNHAGAASIDGGYTCMHLVKNNSQASTVRGAGRDRGIGIDLVKNHQVDTLDSAAKDLGVTVNQLKTDIPASIRGGAAVLRDYALQLSASHTLPTSLADWYGAVAAYSNATTQSMAHLYADSVYKLINAGFSGTTETGEVVTLAPQQVQPNVATAANVKAASSLPQGCANDGKTEFPGAIDCIVDPATFDCNVVSDTAPCTYLSANRPNDLPINFVAIHDIEGSALDAINAFEDPNTGVSIHYIVDTDGTIYQLLHEKDIGFHIGNFWYNQRSIGIEHTGFDATGFLWYNATMYLSSAKLVAYLTNKYHIPKDHDHIVSHGTVPSPTLASSPNHVDPGPYWLWDYYLKLISQQDPVAASSQRNDHIISLHPSTGKQPLGRNGTETAANFNFFYLYNGPSTQSGLIAPQTAATDITDETIDVETDISYYALTKVKDPAGTGNTMYEIWYGQQAHSRDATPDFTAHGKLVWLAVPASAVKTGSSGTAIQLHASGSAVANVYGRPTTSDANVIGDAPNNAVFVSLFTAIEDGTNNLWYEINYNHRQAWVPATEITVLPAQNA
jgi:N-acetyl-anhydromuramyl-L-alanine amidase AmpD